MFANAIQKTGEFTRPILTISRFFGSTQVNPGTATLFFVNENGDAVTCRHVAKLVMDAERINRRYEDFKKKRSEHPENAEKLAAQYGYNSTVLAEMRHNFVDTVDHFQTLQCVFHPKHDLALIRMGGFTRTLYRGHAVFAKDDHGIQPGDFLCRLGFPFPEFSGYFYDAKEDRIGFDPKGRLITPRFPSEGMFTRHLGGDNGEMIGYELSTPGLPGQSGGPLFNKEGIVYGMQYETKHLPIHFNTPGNDQKLYLNVGHCLSAGIIKKFLSDHGVRYYTEEDLERDNAPRVYKIC